MTEEQRRLKMARVARRWEIGCRKACNYGRILAVHPDAESQDLPRIYRDARSLMVEALDMERMGYARAEAVAAMLSDVADAILRRMEGRPPTPVKKSP